MASTVSNGNDRSEKWQRLFTKGKFAEPPVHENGVLILCMLAAPLPKYSLETPSKCEPAHRLSELVPDRLM